MQNDKSNMKLECVSHSKPIHMKSIMCEAEAYEARHIVQFIMGIALDLFSYRARQQLNSTQTLQGEAKQKKEVRKRNWNHWEFNCLAK